jgi:hypothetical protein
MTKNWLVAYSYYPYNGGGDTELVVETDIFYSMDFPTEKFCKERVGINSKILSVTEVPDGWRED